MVNKCCVPNCKSGYATNKEKNAIFRIPSNKLPEFNQAIPRKDRLLTANDFVCQKHFLEQFIVKEDQWKNPLSKWRLTEDALPTIFPNCPSYLSTTLPRKRRKICKSEHDKTAGTSNAEAEDMFANVPQENTLFRDIWNNKFSITFPSTSWSMCRVSQDSSDDIIVLLNVEIVNNIPVSRKKIVLQTNTIFELFFDLNRINSQSLNINSNIISTTSELENLINVFDKVKICNGIENIQIHSCNIPTDLAAKNTLTNRWHHINCVRFFEGVCHPCRCLKNTIRMRVARKNGLQKRISMNASKEILRKIGRKRVNAQFRLRQKCKKLKECFIKQQKIISNLSQEGLNEKLSKLDLPPSQLLLIEECIKVSQHKSKKCRRYTHDWLLLCLLFHIRNPSAYKFMLKSDILPLPTPGTIRKYLRNVKIKCGLDESFFIALKKKLATKEDYQKHGIVVLDEMSVRSSRNVNVKTMKFDGLVDFGHDFKVPDDDINQLADHALVFMFASLGENFKQPVAVYASKNAVKGFILSKLVVQVIMELEKAGAIVDGIICDGASTNRYMWKLFGISGDVENPVNKIKHPANDARDLYFFSDTPHLIKCVRNCMERKPHLMPPDGKVQWHHYEILFSEDKKLPGKLRICPKLTESHLKPTNFMKMRVKLATQVFSNSVTEGLKYFSKTVPKLTDCSSTIHFTKRINDLFDSMNRRRPKEGIKLDGKDLETLNKNLQWLNDWEQNCNTGKIKKDEFLPLTTAHGLRVSIKSTIELTIYLLKHCNFKYVLTGKMNQDCIEHFFGIIRQAGGQNDHPTFMTFLQLYRMLSVYKLIKPPRFGNCSLIEEKMKPSITFEDFTTIFGEKEECSMRTQHVNRLKARLDGLITASNWECDEVIEQDYAIPEAVDCIVYYLTGFVCRHFLKSISCENCKKSLTRTGPVAPNVEAELTNLKTRGFLVHPNINIYNLLRVTEKYFAMYCGSIDVYEQTLSAVLENSTNLTFPCQEHKEDMIGNILYYYVTVRMRPYVKQESGEVVKKSREKKKESRLQSN